MFCSNCGNQNPDNINYCAACGSKLREVPEYADVNNYQTNNFSAINIAPTDAKTFRRFAREKLEGKWGNAALLMLIYTLLLYAMAFVSAFIPLIGDIAFYIISPVLSFGLLVLWIKLKNGENINFLDFFSIGFNNFANVWGVLLRVALKFIVPIIILLVGTILIPVGMIGISAISPTGFDIASVIMIILIFVLFVVAFIFYFPIYYKYMFALNELAYSPNLSTKDIVERSGNFMMGKRLGAFWLGLTFIGWMLLGVLGCGIPLLWITPYMEIANIIYYEWASNRFNG